ncbi:MAG: hypothetical protein ACLQFI_02990 [Methylocella sp.]
MDIFGNGNRGMLTIRPAILGLALLLAMMGDSSGQSRRHGQLPINQPAQPTAPDQRGTDQMPFTTKILPGENAKEKAEQEERERREKDEKSAVDKRLADQTQRLADETENLAAYTRWLAGFTLLLFIAAVGQVALFVWQLRLIRESLKDAKVAAEAAETTANIAKDDLLLGQRAYVFVNFLQSIVIDPKTKNVVFWRITPTWTNFGSTPTQNMRNHINCKIFSGPIPPNWDFPDMWGEGISTEHKENVVLPLGPKSIIHGQAIDIAIQDVHDCIEGKNTIYLWGWAEYNDIFINTKKHITRFCNKLVIGGDPTNAEKSSISYPLHHKYNCTDTECDLQGYPANWSPREEIAA